MSDLRERERIQREVESFEISKRNFEANPNSEDSIVDILQQVITRLQRHLDETAELPQQNYADGVTRGMQLAADFIEREADANFMPNEPAKVLMRALALTIRRNLIVRGWRNCGN